MLGQKATILEVVAPVYDDLERHYRYQNVQLVIRSKSCYFECSHIFKCSLHKFRETVLHQKKNQLM